MIVHYWLKSKKRFVEALLLQLVSTGLQLVVPVFVGRLVGRLDPNSAHPMDVPGLWANFFAIVGFSLVAYFIFRASRIIVADVSSRAMYWVRKDVHDAVFRQSFAYFDKVETGQLVARATSDVEQTDMIFGFGLGVGLQSVVQLVGILVSVALLGDVRLSWVFFVLFPASLGTSLAITKKLGPIYLESRNAFGELTTAMRENIVGAPVVRLFGTQEKERRKFARHNRRFLDASVRSVKINSLYMPINYVILGLLVVVTLYVGGSLVISGEMALETLVMFQSYIGMAIFPLVVLGQIMIMYVQADAALTRVREVIESAPDVTEAPNPVSADGIRGEVEFDRVSFGYTSERRVLKDLSFKVPAGKTVAILGTTGSGKTTVINLIPRFYDVSEGRILIDGVDIRDYELAGLRRAVAVVSQDTFLFNRSIEENIKFGREDASHEEVVEAAMAAHIHEFIESLPDGYQTVVGERGTRLSGGQKQRVSIARALIVKPKILILDDSTSSVDVETEYEIQRALAKLVKGTTAFIITQRLSTIRDADVILVLDQGRLVGMGTHEELLETNVLYRQIYETLDRKQSGATGGVATEVA
ncbi:MAG: ABC transporter ATP-binding protein [Promethearchaeota archaeon]